MCKNIQITGILKSIFIYKNRLRADGIAPLSPQTPGPDRGESLLTG